MNERGKNIAIAIVLLSVVIGTLETCDVEAHAGKQFRYDAVIRCREQLQEDAAAHVKLVRFEDGHIVYRCTARGY